MTGLDVAVFLGYLLGMAVLSYVWQRYRPTTDWFLAGRTMGEFPVGLSVMITLFSAVNFVAFPTEVMAHGLYVLAALPVFVLVGFPITRIFIPFFHGMQLTSVYAYLEYRFDRRTRCLASGLFIAWRLFWMATALFATARVVHVVTDIPLPVVILLAGGVASVYTAVGGIRAVMWTDVIQFVILFTGIGAALWMSVRTGADGGIGFWAQARAGGQLRPFAPFDPAFFSWRPTVRITLWSGLTGTFVAFLTRYGADQMVVQRYFTARHLRAAVRGFWWNVVAALTALILLAFLGLAIATTFGEADTPAMLRFGAFIKALPFGWTGLLAAGLMAATMSSVDSGLNACLAAWVTDFEQRPAAAHPARCSARHYRWLVFTLAGATILLALWIGRTDDLFALINRVINGVGSPLLALMCLGMFSRTCNARGAWLGGIIGIGCSLAISLGWTGLALHYYAVTNLGVTLLACGLLSRMTSRSHPVTPQQLSWTWSAR